MKASEFDQAFESGEEMLEYIDVVSAKRRRQAIKRVNVDFPTWMIQSLDREARRLGVTRQSVIKVWLAQRLEAAKR